MLDFEDLDKKYVADTDSGFLISLYEKDSIFKDFGNCSVSEAFEKVKSGELQKTFTAQ